MPMSEDTLPRQLSGNQIGEGTRIAPFAAVEDCQIGENSSIWRFVNLYGCEIGDECVIGSFVEIQPDVVIGDRCRIQSHAFLCSLLTIGDDVFVGHGAKFINDIYPPSGDQTQWESTHIGDKVSIGTNATMLPVSIGDEAMVGAGAVVTEDVPPNAVVAGNPAEVVGYRSDE